MDIQGLLNRAFNTSGTEISVQSVGSASAWTGPSDASLQAILNAVYDESAGGVRIVEV